MIRESGAVLLVCLMLLAATSLLGLAAASDHLLNEKMSKNQVEAAEAERQAGIAMAWGESWLFGIPGDQKPSPCFPPCPAGSVIWAKGVLGSAIEYRDEEWWRANALTAGVDPISGTPIMPGGLAFWLVEEIHSQPAQTGENAVPEITWYRLTARSGDTPNGALAVTESILARPWGDVNWKNGFPATGTSPGFCFGFEPPVPCGRKAWRRAR